MGSSGEPTLPSVLAGSPEPDALSYLLVSLTNLLLSLVKSHSCSGPNLGDFLPSMCQSPSCLQDL